MATPAELLDRELRRDGTRPFITAYDGDGNRVELSVATLANWVAKTAGYLEDEVGIEAGERIAVEPTLHWLTAVVLVAGWAVGAEVALQPAPDARLIEVPLDPMGVAFNRLVAAYPDRYRPSAPSGSDQVAAAPALPRGLRVLVTLPLDQAGVGTGLLGPLAAGGSAVYAAMAANLDSITEAERVTHTVDDVAGLPPLG
ncbi:MAG: TIGR03089 family protein [Mycobacteriales bacterium]